MVPRGLHMILGLGTDLAEVSRIAQSIARFGERFLQRVYTPAEIAYCTRKKVSAQSFAARFAAKEAAAKALGTGIARGIGWRDIEVLRAPSGKPSIQFHGRAADRAQRLGVHTISLSLTHSAQLSIAVVILEDRATARVPEWNLP